ncbi:MAG: hypothetical protein H0U53_10855 [Actinobacteria bacterium]|nr:hypothetical protein [Actinomycetota bacterium]
MPRTGGRTPYDKNNALSGPCRVVWALSSVALPTSPVDIVQQVADANGEYPAKTGWNDFGLSADAPEFTHDKETEGLEYEQPTGVLFEEITEINREFTAQIAEIDVENLKIIENSDIVEAVAASAAAAPAASKTAAWQKVQTGLYDAFKMYRIAFIAYRPTGAGVVTEPGPPTKTRPPAVCRVLPLATLAADESALEFERGEPVNAEVTFRVVDDSAAGTGKQHGYWALETAGLIAA